MTTMAAPDPYKINVIIKWLTATNAEEVSEFLSHAFNYRCKGFYLITDDSSQGVGTVLARRQMC